MVIATDGHIVFRQALHARSVEDSYISISDKATVGQRIKAQKGHNLRINRYRGSSAGSVRRGTERTRASRRGRNLIGESVAFILTDSLVIAENEGFPLSDRCSGGCSKLVA